MSNKVCCVPGCSNRAGSKDVLHKFPNPAKNKDRFNTWVFSVGGEILGLSNDHIFKYRRVCHQHFELKYWCRNNLLSNIAVPTKNMPGPEASQDKVEPTIFDAQMKENVVPTTSETTSLNVAAIQPTGITKDVEIVHIPEQNFCSTQLLHGEEATMATEEIAKLLKEVLDNNWNYCAICLRNDRQRKLVHSDSFFMITKRLRLRPPVNKQLCYMCEAQMSRAWRALQAVTFAATINTWYQSSTNRMKKGLDVKDDLHRTTMLLTFEDKSLDQYWCALRARSQLARTESLVVSSNTPAVMCNEGQLDVDVELSGNEAPAPAPTSTPLLESLQQKPDISNVVIIDDEDPPPPPPKLVPIEKLMDEPTTNHLSLTADRQHVMARDSADPGIFVLYPIVTGIDRNLYVPTLNAKIVDDTIEFIQENEISKNTFTSDLEHNVTDELMQFNGSTVRVKIVEQVSKEEKMEEGDGGSGGVKQAIMKDKVDWEDKIPMDVISFVDATDPNAEQYLLADPLSGSDAPDPLNTTSHRTISTSPYQSDSDDENRTRPNKSRTEKTNFRTESANTRRTPRFRIETANIRGTPSIQIETANIRTREESFRTISDPQSLLRHRLSKPRKRYKKINLLEEAEVVIDLC